MSLKSEDAEETVSIFFNDVNIFFYVEMILAGQMTFENVRDELMDRFSLHLKVMGVDCGEEWNFYLSDALQCHLKNAIPGRTGAKHVVRQGPYVPSQRSYVTPQNQDRFVWKFLHFPIY